MGYEHSDTEGNMRRLYAIASLCLALLLATGCQFIFKTPTPIPTPTITATSSPTVTAMAATSTASPTATITWTPVPSPTPTPEPTHRADLGVPAGDTYGIRDTAVDHHRGLLYVLGEEGDASVGQGVLTVVDLTDAQVRASVPVPAALIETPQTALSSNGMRLYLVDRGSSAGDRLLVLSTGVGPEPLGTVLGEVSDVRALALDAVTERLYVADAGVLRRLHARTLAEEARV
ncbi:MAG: hypothetical protein H5T63_06325, partial [Chloroflexi bacterium]|nr:hypothetical protein [Chloroflexota bacterium]